MRPRTGNQWIDRGNNHLRIRCSSTNCLRWRSFNGNIRHVQIELSAKTMLTHNFLRFFSWLNPNPGDYKLWISIPDSFGLLRHLRSRKRTILHERERFRQRLSAHPLTCAQRDDCSASVSRSTACCRYPHSRNSRCDPAFLAARALASRYRTDFATIGDVLHKLA